MKKNFEQLSLSSASGAQKTHPKNNEIFKTQKFFGGALLHKKRKSQRPLSRKDSIHFVLRSTWAMGPDSFLAKRNHNAIKHILLKFSKRFGVRVYQQSINSNHLHLLLRITNRTLYKAFIKALSGKIASHVMQNQSFLEYASGHATSRAKPNVGYGSQASNKARQSDRTEMEKEPDQPVKQSFWQYRPFSRIVNWGRDFKDSVSYLKQNVLEAFGFVPYNPRKNYYNKWTFSKNIQAKSNVHYETLGTS